MTHSLGGTGYEGFDCNRNETSAPRRDASVSAAEKRLGGHSVYERSAYYVRNLVARGPSVVLR